MQVLIGSMFAAMVSLSGAWAGEPMIREIASFREALSALTASSMIIIDLDNTTFEATQMLGSDQFFSYLVRRGVADGLTEREAKARALEQSRPIQPVSPVRAVEAVTPGLIAELQARNFPVFALTARPFAWVLGTTAQVASLGIDFSRTTPTLQADLREGRMRQGIFFLADGVDKGTALIGLLHSWNLRPAHVVFIDDKLSNVQSVSRSLAEADIPHTTFRLGAADARVAAFDERIAETFPCNG
jgi:hypothetical protein